MSESLKQIRQYENEILIGLLILCTEDQQQNFKRMYSHKNLQANLEDIVADMPEDKLRLAIKQCERTIENNKKR